MRSGVSCQCTLFESAVCVRGVCEYHRPCLALAAASSLRKRLACIPFIIPFLIITMTAV